MGQNVEIKNTTIMGDILIVDTDRSFTGQDGQAIAAGSDGISSWRRGDRGG